ncbi:DNA cytosine methyltransferase [Vibrio sp. R78045]|uniref:DNA cytosine methyltransferase n=1 Tax=Vibrio sp. R78045 TaxID=3093868 RepID=UPI0036F2B1EF
MKLINRVQKYSVKHLSSGASRIYINNSFYLRLIGFVAGVRYSLKETTSGFILKFDENGTNCVMSSGRGELVELKNKTVAKKFESCNSVRVVFSKDGISITSSVTDSAIRRRNESLKFKVNNNLPLKLGSLFSGLGLLSKCIKDGLFSSGVLTEMEFANDNDELVLNCNIQGNPIWKDASKSAVATGEDIQDLVTQNLPEVDVLEVGLVCKNQSKLCPSHMRDLNHSVVGTLFMSLLSVIRKMNPAVLLIENAQPFLTSQTFDLLSRELIKDYTLSTTVLEGYAFGDYEERKRGCIVAVSKGLPELSLSSFASPISVDHKPLSEILEPIDADSVLWKKMGHVKKKLLDPKLNFKNVLHYPNDTKIKALSATYASPKIGSPMVGHPNDSDLQRHFTWLEHSRIRRVPESLERVLETVANGTHCMSRTKSNVGAVHRMCGNSVSPLPWTALGEFIGNFLKKSLCFNRELLTA